MTTNEITVGTLFTRTDERPYRLDGGERGVHVCTTLNEVVSTDRVGFAYSTIEVVSESGRPPFAGDPTGGTMAWFGWDAAVAKGRVAVVI